MLAFFLIGKHCKNIQNVDTNAQVVQNIFNIMNKSLMLKEIKLHLGIKNDAQFADFLGIKPNVLSAWHRRNTFDIDILYTKCRDISPDWLLTGEGEMLKRGMPDVPVAKTMEASTNGIPLIPATAFAGGFSGELQVLEHECERYVIPLFKDADFLIPVKGSSMYPKYSSGDVVACKRLKEWSFFQWGKVYVLYTSQGPIIKRICEGKDDNHIFVVSDNKERYAPFQLHKSEIIDVALVVGVMRQE